MLMCVVKKSAGIFSVKLIALMLLVVVATNFLAAAETKGAPQKRTIVFKEMKIKGTIQKPEAIYILSRARFSYQTFNLNVSFIGNIKDVIKDDGVF